MISHRSHRLKHRSLAVAALATLVALLLPALSAAAQEVADSSGSVPAEQSVSLSIPGFDSSIGELAQVDLVVSGSFEGRVESVTSRMGYVSDIIVTSEVDVCAHEVPAGDETTYFGCLGTGGHTTVFFTADVVGEAFVAMAPGQTATGSEVTVGSGAGSITLLDPAAFASFVDKKAITFAAASTTRAEATTNGSGYHDVSVETLTDITVSAQYGYIALDLAATGATYTVTNTGNMRMVDINVIDSAGDKVCSVYALAPNASETCTGNAAGGAVTVSGAAGLNPAVRTTAGATGAGSASAATSATQNSIPATVAPTQADGAFGFASVDIQPSVQAAAITPANDDAAASAPAASTSATAAASNPPAAAAASAAEAPPVAAAHPAAATESATAPAAPATNSTPDVEPADDSSPSPAASSGSVVRVAYSEDNAPFLAYTGGDAGSSAILGFMLTGLGLVFFAASRAVRER